MPISMVPRVRALVSYLRSQRKSSHKTRQKAADKRYYTLSEIHGKDANETFARRIAYLRKLDPLIFEELVLDGFKRNGFLVERGVRYSGDGGLDGKVYQDGQWLGIQCKRYSDSIATSHVDQFATDLKKFKLNKGYFVHTGKTPIGVRHKYRQITILSGQKLIDFLIGV